MELVGSNPEKLRSANLNPGVKLVLTTLAWNLEPGFETVLESVGSNPEKSRGLNPELSTNIVNSCTGIPSTQWTIRPWGTLCTNITVKLVKVTLPDTCHTNSNPEIIFNEPNLTKHDTFKINHLNFFRPGEGEPMSSLKPKPRFTVLMMTQSIAFKLRIFADQSFFVLN